MSLARDPFAATVRRFRISQGARDRIQVYAFTEPSALRDRAVPARRYQLRYPDGAHNAEALLVQPGSGRLMVVTKARRGAGFYRAPQRLTTSGVNRLVRIGPAPRLVTAGSVRPGGGQICLRDYQRACLYRHVGASPRRVALPSTRQGESLTFGTGGGSPLLGTGPQPGLADSPPLTRFCP